VDLMPRHGCIAAYPTPAREAALAWLDCLIEREVLRLRARYELSLDELRGLYISDRQVDELLRKRLGDGQRLDPAAALSARAQALAPLHHAETPFGQLGARLGIPSAQLDVLLLALAPELDLRYETLFAYLNNDVTRKHLTVDLALRLLDRARPDAPMDHPRDIAMVRRAWFARSSPLLASGAIEPVHEADQRSTLQQGLVLAPLVSQALTGQPLVDARWPAGVRWLAIDVPAVSAATLAAIEASVPAHLAMVTGHDAADRLAAGAAWARWRKRDALLTPLSAFALEGGAAQIKRVLLAARLNDAAIVLDDDAVRDPPSAERAAPILRMLTASGAHLVLLTQAAATWSHALLDLPYARIEVGLPSVAERASLWRGAFAANGFAPQLLDTKTANGDAAGAGDALVQSLAERFAIGPARVAAAAASVRPSVPSASLDPHIHARQLAAQASARTNDALMSLATRLARDHDWSQLVLPDNTTQQLREIAAAIRQRERVYRHWGMLKRTGRNAGLMMLFTGASGTGKTMAASVVANAAELDLYRIDLASVVSKYIGETEQNLERIFIAARGSSAMLLFDEADALMGKRSEVKDAHDRYANLEVAYLLQKMEEHDGVVILASNLPKNLDSAFTRRMHYTIEFARPNASLRERLWRGIYPSTVPLADDINWRFLADKFETTGGDIQAIALDAAFLAAAGGDAIGMAQLMRAMSRRQTKQGNPGGLARFEAHRAAMSRAQPFAETPP
jgi:SpoVK/Ycf46/Vps4 family AAA+-type ATPase